MTNKTTILVIEDDQFLRDLIFKKLEKEGFKVEMAIDGQEGFNKIAELKPSLVLLDIILPIMDGFEVLKKIRSHSDQAIQKIPIVLLSNLGQDTDVEKGKSLGANDYLVKAAFTTDEIVEKVKTHLKG